MRKIKPLLQTFLFAAMIAFSFSANAVGPTVTVRVHESDGTTAISGAVASYFYLGSYTVLGTTDVSGTTSNAVPISGTYNFTVTYKGTYSTQANVIVNGDMTLDYYTTGVNMNVSTCSSPVANLQGVALRYNAQGTNWNLSNTDASGNGSTQIFCKNASGGSSTIDFTATYRGTSQIQHVDLTNYGDGTNSGNNISVTFNPTAVTNYSGGYYVALGTNFSTSGTVYMFPGTYPFHFGTYSTNITISGCTQSFVANILVLKDHNGNPLAGGLGRGGYGTNFGTWFAGGGAPTDANGVLFDIRSTNSAPTTMSYEMKYNNTTSVLTQDVSQPGGNIFNFKTIELRLRLETCGGTGLSGGTGRWGNGATFGTYYFPSPNSTDGNGETAAEWFPGTYSFEMNYQTTSNVKSSVVIPNANTKLTWQTTNVTLSWPYDIAYGGSGDSRYFNKPSMELLPGTVNFNFRSPNGYNYIPLTISGCSMAPTVGNVRLINSTGGPISGGSVDGYQGGWSHYGTTDANGNLLVLGKNPTSLAMTYVGGREQKNGINFNTTPVVTFQTVKTTMEIKDHSNNYTLEGDHLQYYAGGWHVFGSGNTASGKETMELLPVSYSFAMNYLGGRQQINNQNVGTNPVVTFTTTEVTMEIKDHNGGYTLNADNNGLSYYAGGWKVFGTGNTTNGKETMEMLPVSYSFALVYKGGRQQINNQNVGTNPVVTFQTTEVTMELKDHNGGYTLNADNNGLSYYAGGWKVFGTGNTTNGKETMEMLPASYSFALSYLGGRQQINNQNVGTTPLVSFQTNIANMYLLDGVGSPISGGSATYYAGAWHSVGTTDGSGLATIELLPVSYSFRMAYGGKSNQQNGITVPADMYFVYDGTTITYSATNPFPPVRRVTGTNNIMEDQVISSEVRTFPNPASDQLRITFGSTVSKSSEIKLIDLSGRTVVKQPIAVQQGQNTYMMSVGKLTNGVYLLTIGNSKISKNKVVVLHQ